MQREQLGSRLGFILLSAGSAIGIGNVWKFPSMAGRYGGGVFVLIYLLFLVILGLPIMTMEFSMGRASRRSPVKLYEPFVPEKSPWKLHGWGAMAGSYLLMMFYTPVTGWMLYYFFATLQGKFSGMDTQQVEQAFVGLTQQPVTMILFTSAVVILGFWVCSIGLQSGLERVGKYVMVALLAVILLLAANSFTLEGAGEGLSFYLLPDWQRAKEIGISNVVVGAATQAFFTLSLGIGSMATFGSYINRDRALLGESATVAALDTFVAMTAGLIMFPACFTYGVEVSSGPNLIFMTLPNVFNHMAGGRVWGSFFFLFMFFAAFSTVLAVFESILACCMDLFGWSRKKASLINCLFLLVAALPCVLGFNLLSGLAPLGKNIMDWEDFLVSNLLLPGGSLLFVLFCTGRKGWGWDNFVSEANAGRGLKIRGWMRGYMTWVLPVMVAVLLLTGLYSYFFG